MSDKNQQKGQITDNLNKVAKQSHDRKGHGDTPISFYGKDKKFVYVYKKTEKLVSAIYLLTSFFDENEPLRKELRTNVIKLLNDQLGLIQEVGTSSIEVHDRIRKHALHIVSLLQAGFYAGLISEMNFNVLRKEFMALLEKLSEEPAEEESVFSNTFFDVPTEIEHKGDVPATVVAPIEIKKTSYETESKGQDDKVSVKKNDRRSTILAIVKEKGKVSIKDISQEVTGCSEKTIQRELGAMVDEGMLRKEGERRWSRYSIV